MRLEDFENDDERVIRDRMKQKTWNEIRSNDSWAIFKIMAEFVNGFETMGRIGPCVSIFGSARTKPDHKHYLLTEKIAYNISRPDTGSLREADPELWKPEIRARMRVAEHR